MVELEAPFICEDGGGGTAASCTNTQHQRRNIGPTEAQLGGDKYVPDTEEVYWQRDPAESVEGRGGKGTPSPEATRKGPWQARYKRPVCHYTTASTDSRAQRSFDRTET